MRRSATVDWVNELKQDRARGRAASVAGRALAAVVVAIAACGAGVTLGRILPPLAWPGVALNGSPTATAMLMAGGVGLTGLLAGGVAGLLGGATRRVDSAARHGFGWAAVGAIAGGLGPVLAALTGGRLPAPFATAVACGVAALLAALVGHTRRQPEPLTPLADDWTAEPVDQAPEPAIGRTPDAGLVVRQWPILLVSAACLLVIVVAPQSPAAWPLLAVAFLGFAVAWALARQDRRLRALEDHLRERAYRLPEPKD